jgi:hypothetical protein
MERNNLRKVKYFTSQPNKGFDPERTTEDESFQGFFHTWAVAPYKSPYDDTYYNRTMAVVEQDDGSILEIPAEWVTFIS